MPFSKTPFGFEDVSVKEKTTKVHALFERVAPYYDLMNDLMSVGLHRCWKKRFFKEIRPSFQEIILDVAGGTGDIACGLKKFYPYLDLNINVLDLSFSMIENGIKRSSDQGVFSDAFQNFTWICGNAETLPLAENSIDIYTIVFGMRNIGHVSHAIKEAVRVLKPGGRFFCLEFSPVQSLLIENTILKKAYDFYLFQVLPHLGKTITNDEEAYRYLAESIRRFPEPHSFVHLLEEGGLTEVRWKPWSEGIVALHQGKKP